MTIRSESYAQHLASIFLITIPIISIIIFGLELNPDVNFSLPLSFQMKLYFVMVVYVIGLFTSLFIAEYRENARRSIVSGFTVYAVATLIAMLVGLVILGLMLVIDYDFGNASFNVWISSYLWVGALSLFILFRTHIFLHHDISKRL